MQFHNFDSEAFRRDSWQQQPMVIRGAWLAWSNPLEPDELAGLACEDEIEARLVIGGAGDWVLEDGPFAEDRFAALGDRPWTLLVQAVDHQVPAVAALIEPFRFVPNWRIDDVMVSYATDGGGVGPHFDQYDVFLIQGLGKRRWQVGKRCDETTELLPHEDLRLLAEFEATDEWVLEPGDILYVPPGYAHNGVAMGDDCMTYSVGFRAPSRAELVGHWCQSLMEDLSSDDRYGDPGLAEQANPGEITAPAIAALHAMVTEAMSDKAAFARWFGEYNSAPKYPEIDWAPEVPLAVADLSKMVADGQILCRNPASRFSFIRQAGGAVLFVDGESYECAGDLSGLAEQLCGTDAIVVDAGSDAQLCLIAGLHNRGCLGFDDEE
ncbi:MAG: cupin domain-containing protein [Novosphingobium sp.]|uniref:JmjC domain-containing protein n=1 Tax=Novosphingobium sp. TaxID=1874826 RepID=UPI0032BC30BA